MHPDKWASGVEPENDSTAGFLVKTANREVVGIRIAVGIILYVNCAGLARVSGCAQELSP